MDRKKEKEVIFNGVRQEMRCQKGNQEENG